MPREATGEYARPRLETGAWEGPVGLFDRFTRDEVSAKVWWPFALLFIVLAVATFRMQNLAVDQRRVDASAWATSVIRDGLEPSVATSDVTRSLNDPQVEALNAALAPVLVEGSVEAVRVWSDDGALLYSSSPGDAVGSREALNDVQLQAALGDPTASLSVLSERSLTGERTDPSFLTYAAFAGAPSLIGEVQLDEGAMLADLTSWWTRARLLLLLGAALTLLLALASMREPVAPIGAGVKFYPGSLPSSFVVVDQDELVVRESTKQARRRSEAAERRIEELEGSKLALEAELQRALSALAALRAQQGVTPRAIPPAPTPAVVRLPEVAEPEPAGQIAQEPARLHSVPEPARGSIAEADRASASSSPDNAVTDEPDLAEIESFDIVETPEKVSASEPERTKVEPEPEPEPEPKPEPELVVIPEPEPELVVIPEPEPASAVAPSSARPGDEAVDVLNRLVSPAGSPGSSTVDPGEIRAKLARTAALKKPGSRERREEQERRARSEQDPH